MKTLLIAATLGAALIGPAIAQQAPRSQIREGWAARQHVYAAEYYARQTGNSNTNSDFQLVRER
jgi:opacity protein-like surface antigen